MMDGGNVLLERGVRTKEDVDHFIEHAKLTNDDLAPVSQILYFADKFEDVKLLELNSDIQEAFKEGQNVVFRGEKDKKAVLCTDSLTFELLEAETSNSSLLVPNLSIIPSNNTCDTNTERYLEEKTIDGVFYSYYELRKIKSPFLFKLESLLSECLYCGPENEHLYNESSSRKFYSTEDLLNICQANSLELNEALSSVGACNIDGYWRLLDFHFHLRVLSQLLNLVNSNSWSVDAIPETETIDTLEEIFPRIIVQHVFSLHTLPAYERNNEGDALFSFIEDKVCRFLGEALLRDGAGMDFDLQQFTEAWQSSVPEGMNTDLRQLVGVAVVFENNRVPQIKLCSEKDLPRNIHDRIQQIFTIKKKWTLDELSPYIKPLLPEKTNIKSIIMKYATELVVDGIKWYSQRM